MEHPNIERDPSEALGMLPERKIDLLRRYVGLLAKWRKITNLVSERSFADVWTRHIADSIHVQQARPDALRWLDLGTGAGFPGIVIGICLVDSVGAEVHCVESDKKKCAFLRLVTQSLVIPVKVHNLRAEDISSESIGRVDVVTSRAFSTVTKILDCAQEFLHGGAVAILPRGGTYLDEVVSLDPTRYIVKVDSNPGHSDGVFVTIRERGAEIHVG